MLRSIFERMGDLPDELRYRLLKILEENPSLSQRELAQGLGISLGKLNYCLKALIEKGWIKARNFKNSRHKLGYLYLLTPRGLEEKARVTYRFLKLRLAEVEALQRDIEELQKQARMRKQSSAAR